MNSNEFLPMSREEMAELGYEQLDFIVVTPDAYVDHPSFAAAVIGRFVQSLGYSVGIIAQPNWESADDFKRLGPPRYAFLLSGGNIDGIVNMYTAARRRRSEDVYSPGGKTGLRPGRPTIAYTARLKQAYKDIPVIIGGVEASNRRFAHYDYYEDKVRRSYLVDSKADLLVYGMGEAPLAEICGRLKNGESVRDMLGVRGTCVLRSSLEGIGEYVMLPSFERVAESKRDFANACRLIHQHTSPRGKILVQPHGDRYLIQFPPPLPLSTPEMDAIYGLPFTRRQHPSYKEPVPALSEVQFGIITVRGCPGQCAFCSISAHQGKRIQKRSKKSIVEEARRMAAMPEFKGIISDVGGPTANFYDATCLANNPETCTRSCLTPKPCPNLKVSHKGLCEVLEALEKVEGVRRVFIRSGLRYDYLMADKDGHFFDRLVKKHVSGQLKVAPEHVSGEVLRLMNKPGYAVYERFARRFEAATKKAGKPQYLLPYYISSHPGSTLNDAIELALTLKKQGFVPEQVQDFYPTPGTISTCMFYTGLDPMTGKPVYVARTPREKAMQRALLQFDQKRNWPLIREALREAGREDLIGPGGLVPAETRPSRKGRAGGSKAAASEKTERGGSKSRKKAHDDGIMTKKKSGKGAGR
ncbi:MAG: YgiQ family radical SAM protein [Christensenellaceae bacterium]|nr:YgiQ family radical SAM protein [Christensenellaceae bacterium]